MRTATVQRTTKETDIAIAVNLDGTGDYSVSTGIGFLDHMVEQLSRHSLIDISMQVKGDLHIDQHHTVEDSALALGEAVAKALGDKRGIARYGEAHAPTGQKGPRIVPALVPKLSPDRGITLHIETLYGENNHHIAESMYKALARALRQAVEIDPRKGDAIPSTKGVL